MRSSEVEAPSGASPSHASGLDRARRAFTLLEVMAAVAILSIWYLIITNAAVHGLRAEGVSLRRLEAAQLADRTLADIEAEMLDGSVPEEQSESTEEGDFVVRVDVKRLVKGIGGPNRRRRRAATAGESGGGGGLKALLRAEMPGVSKYLYAIIVRVTWEEAGAKRRVLRTTYGFDLQKAVEAFETQAGLEPAGAESAADSGATGGEKP